MEKLGDDFLSYLGSFPVLWEDGGLRRSEPFLWCCGDVRRKSEDGRKTFLLKMREELRDFI